MATDGAFDSCDSPSPYSRTVQDPGWIGLTPIGMHVDLNNIKDQGDAPFCMFYASTSAWEHKLRLERNIFHDVSIQQLLDGYWGQIAPTGVFREEFLAYMDSTTTTTARNYPFAGKPMGRKPFIPIQFVARPFFEATWKKVDLEGFENYEDAMKEALNDNYLLCFVNASKAFIRHKGGFFHHETLIKPANHAVLVISVGNITTEDGIKPYWLVQNSQGKEWGENGLMYMERRTNCLGIGISAYYPVLMDDNVHPRFPILERIWPIGWKNFLCELVQVAKTTKTNCEKCLVTLQRLSEAFFGFSRGVMTEQKFNQLKTSLGCEFILIYEFCLTTLSTAECSIDKCSTAECSIAEWSQLIRATLATLHAIMTWVPASHIVTLQSKLLNILVKITAEPAYFNLILPCFTKFAALNFKDLRDIAYLKTKYSEFICQIVAMLTSYTNIRLTYANATIYEQAFIHNSAIFFIALLKSHIWIYEDQDNVAAVVQRMEYLLGYLIDISYVDDTKVFKVCLEYWNYFVLEMQGMSEQKRQMYACTMSKLRSLMICRMAKPEEVLIVEDTEGNIVRETMRDNDVLVQYKIMRETLGYLSNLDPDDTEKKMLEKVNQLNREDWSRNNLNTFCWAVGSLSGYMWEEKEYRLFVMVIHYLLELYDNKTRSEDDKAVIASNIMYVVGQYPGLLEAHWDYLKFVVGKLLMFMRATHPGVQDMACDTVLKIVQKCKNSFVSVQIGEGEPFVSGLLQGLSATITNLGTHQILTFYETVGHMITAESDPQKRSDYMQRLMEHPYQRWANIIREANKNEYFLDNPEVIKDVLCILQKYTSAAMSLGTIFFPQIQRIIVEGMLDVYGWYSGLVSSNIDVVLLRLMKRETLELLETFLQKDVGLQLNEEWTNAYLLPMMEYLLTDYEKNETVRESEVLSLFATIINKYKNEMMKFVPGIFKAVFNCTSEVISMNFEHHSKTIMLLQAICAHCESAMSQLSFQQLEVVMPSILWSFGHSDRSIAVSGFRLLNRIMMNCLVPELFHQFYEKYFFRIEHEIVKALTDTFHKSGFNFYVVTLRKLFWLVKFDILIKPGSADPYPRVMEMTIQLFSSSLPSMTADEVLDFVCKLHQSKTFPSMFRAHVRDFLVQSTEFSVLDNQDMYVEETFEEDKFDNFSPVTPTTSPWT